MVLVFKGGVVCIFYEWKHDEHSLSSHWAVIIQTSNQNGFFFFRLTLKKETHLTVLASANKIAAWEKKKQPRNKTHAHISFISVCFCFFATSPPQRFNSISKECHLICSLDVELCNMPALSHGTSERSLSSHVLPAKKEVVIARVCECLRVNSGKIMRHTHWVWIGQKAAVVHVRFWIELSYRTKTTQLCFCISFGHLPSTTYSWQLIVTWWHVVFGNLPCLCLCISPGTHGLALKRWLLNPWFARTK